MLKRVILILICVLTFADSDIFAQTKITLETTSLPKEFEGHDAVILVKNLDALLKNANFRPPSKTVAKVITYTFTIY